MIGLISYLIQLKVYQLCMKRFDAFPSFQKVSLGEPVAQEVKGEASELLLKYNSIQHYLHFISLFYSYIYIAYDILFMISVFLSCFLSLSLLLGHPVC